MRKLEDAWLIRRVDTGQAVHVCDALIDAVTTARIESFENLELERDESDAEDQLQCAKCLKGLINIYNSHYDFAKELLDEALKHLHDGHLPQWLARCLNAQGYLNAVQGKPGEALLYFREGLEWSKVIKDYDLCVFIFFNIAELYREVLERYDEAKYYYEEALNYANKANGHVLIGSIYSNLSTMWQFLGNHDLALSFSQMAIEVAKQNDDALALGICYENLAEFYREGGDLDKAWSYASLSEIVRSEIDDRYANASTWVQKAKLSLARNDFDEAIMWGRKSLKSAALLRSNAAITSALFVLARSYEHLGNLRFAMLYYKAYSKKTAEKFSTHLAAQMSIVTSEARFTELKKDAEIYRLRNVELKEKSEAIERAVHELQQALESLKSTQDQLLHAEKMAALGKLVAGVAHEINTPLGISITLTSFLDEKMKAITDVTSAQAVDVMQIREHIQDSQEAIITMDKSLSRAADIVRSFKNLALHSELLEIQTIVFSEWLDIFLKHFTLEHKHDLHTLVLESELIVMEAYTNAIKAIITELLLNVFHHAYKKTDVGQIMIKAYQKQGYFTLICRDYGVGIDHLEVETLFDPFVTSKRVEGHMGLGLHGVFNIVKQILKGEIYLSAPEGGGFKVEIKFPLRYASIKNQ